MSDALSAPTSDITSTARDAPPSNVQKCATEQYAQRIHEACEHSKKTDLFSNAHYQPLSDFLKSVPDRHSSEHTLDPGTAASNSPPRENPFTFVVVYTIIHDDIQSHYFDNKTGLNKLWAFPDIQPSTDQIIFVRGSLSPAWVKMLGAKYHIDPEVFCRHLRYLPGNVYSGIRTLPSASTNIISLPVTSMYFRKFASDGDGLILPCYVDSGVVEANQKGIRQSASAGKTVIRKVSTLTSSLVSMEHDISIYIKQMMNDCRLAIVFLDNGLNLDQSSSIGIYSYWLRSSDDFVWDHDPILIPRPDTIHTGITHPVIPVHDQYYADQPDSFCHVVSFLPFHFGASVDKNYLSTTPRPNIVVLLRVVFTLVANSECQFLNHVHGVLNKEQMAGYITRREQNPSTVVYIKGLLDDHRSRLQEIIAFLDHCSYSSPDTDVTRQELDVISTDFKELLSRNKSLGEISVGSMNLIMNNAMLKESQKAVETADTQKRLTRLAYLFLPVSLATSIFGMNVKELGTGNQSIWVPAVLLIVLALLAIILSERHALEGVWQSLWWSRWRYRHWWRIILRGLW